MAVDFHPEVLTGARESRNRDAVRVTRCLDVERMMNLTEVPAVIERATSEPRQDLQDFSRLTCKSCQSCKIL